MHAQPAPTGPDAPPARHFGLDWLRMGAFALLVPFHAMLAFSPWPWLIKTGDEAVVLVPFLALLAPWRLDLLFLVSGYATRHIFMRSGSVRGFLSNRTERIMLPFLAGMVLLVPVEMWIRVRLGGYPGSLLQFWSIDYWRIGDFYGVAFPSFEHLWFLIYLWTYTLLLGALLFTGGQRGLDAAQRAFAWLGEGSRLLVVPLVLLVVIHTGVRFTVPGSTDPLLDLTHASEYLPFLFFGFLLAGTDRLWPAVSRLWKAAALVTLGSGAIVLGTELSWVADMPRYVALVDQMASIAMAWGMALTLLHLANRFLNRDHPWRAKLNEAVFPLYLIHHGAIVVTVYLTLGSGIAWPIKFLLALAAAFGAGLAFYFIGRRITWLRPLIGLRAAKPRAAADASVIDSKSAIAH